MIGVILYSALFIGVFIYLMYTFAKEMPTFYAMREEDKKATLIYCLGSVDRVVGHIRILADGFEFTDMAGREVIKIPFREIYNCTTESSNPTGRIILALKFFITPYHYLRIFKKDKPAESITFRFNFRAFQYVKDLYTQITGKICRGS